MSGDTRAALAAAVEAHGLARAALAATGPDEALAAQETHDQTRRAAEDAARAHLAAVDPAGLKAIYDEALEAHHAAPGATALAEEALAAGEEYAAARTAQRVAEGRWDMGVHTPGGEG